LQIVRKPLKWLEKSFEALKQTSELFTLPLEALGKPLKTFIQVVRSVKKSRSNLPSGRSKRQEKSLEFTSKRLKR